MKKKAAPIVVPPLHPRMLESYVASTRDLVLDKWQKHLCGELEKAFWLSVYSKFEDEFVKIDFGTGPAYQIAPSGYKLLQDDIDKHMDTGTRTAIHAPPQFGKLCADDTPVFTPQGWTTHGSLKPGDYVFGRDGKPALVEAESAPDFADYAVTFTDGEVIKCHGRHEWAVFDRKGHRPVEKTLETAFMAMQSDLWLGSRGRRGGRARFQVDANVAVETIDRDDLLIQPYMLGAWLGDGTSSGASLTYDPRDKAIVRFCEEIGYKPLSTQTHKDTGIKSTYFKNLLAPLRAEGVLNKKHIPDRYLAASVRQRLELLAGLIDTDGSVYQPNGRVQFTNTNPRLVNDVERLVATLGWRSSTAIVEPCESSSGIVGTKPTYQVCFSPTRTFPTILKRKQITKITPMRRKRGIVSIARCDPTPGKCIQVQGGVYLVGETLVPTHNSIIISQCYPAWILGWDPMHRFRLATYNVFHSARFSKVVQYLLRSAEHKRLFPDPAGYLPIRCKFSEWSTNARIAHPDGQSSFAGLGLKSGFVGTGADTLLMDDPYKGAHEAMSETIRDSTWAFWTDTAAPRMTEQANVFIMFHRYHQDDMGGRAIASGQFGLLRYAAQCDGSYVCEALGEDVTFPDPIGREEGEYLSPRFPEAYYLRQKRNEQVWYSQFQGRPSAKTGKMFQVALATTILPSRVPPILHMVRAWDNAATEGGGAFTAGCKMGIDGAENVYIFDMERKQVGTAERQMLQETTAQADGKLVQIHVPQDPGSAGKDVAFQFQQELSQQDYVVTVTKVNGTKEMRAYPVSKAWNSGKVFLVLNADGSVPAWHKPFIEEARYFPGSTFKDQIDATADAYSHLLRLFFRGLVIKTASQTNLLHRSLFTKRFGDKVPAHCEVAVGLRLSSDVSRPSGYAITTRAAENMGMGEMVFVVAARRMYVDNPLEVLMALQADLTKHCAKGVDHPHVMWLNKGASTEMQVTAQKLDLRLTEFKDLPSAGVPETNWYLQRLNAKSFFYDEKISAALGAARCYALVDDVQYDRQECINDDGMLSLRQDWETWSYTDKGEIQPFGGIVLDCVRMTMYRFHLSATILTDEERRLAKLPPEHQPNAVRAKLGTPQFFEAVLAQEHAIKLVKLRELDDQTIRARDQRNATAIGPRAVTHRFNRSR